MDEVTCSKINTNELRIIKKSTVFQNKINFLYPSSSSTVISPPINQFNSPINVPHDMSNFNTQRPQVTIAQVR